MTRTDLLNKKVDQLNNIGEALELISLLNYGECIAVLMNTKNIPSEIHAALMKRAKEANGGTTLELVIAGMQNVVNGKRDRYFNNSIKRIRLRGNRNRAY